MLVRLWSVTHHSLPLPPSSLSFSLLDFLFTVIAPAVNKPKDHGSQARIPAGYPAPPTSSLTPTPPTLAHRRIPPNRGAGDVVLGLMVGWCSAHRHGLSGVPVGTSTTQNEHFLFITVLLNESILCYLLGRINLVTMFSYLRPSLLSSRRDDKEEELAKLGRNDDDHYLFYFTNFQLRLQGELATERRTTEESEAGVQLRERIADAMWAQYLQTLDERGEDDEDSDFDDEEADGEDGEGNESGMEDGDMDDECKLILHSAVVS
ncbi:hypothetical protein R3P38DRAFT_3293760 [Favolaschia claudopus]|uniref:Uncharacterized protein n=1 Tax=Favolaschia claudopus TaxID=2862362 RepID=A0AAV9ZHP6_9AGAR